MRSPMQTRFETMMNDAERRALLTVLRAKPDITLGNLHEFLRGPYGATLRTITVRELIDEEIRSRSAGEDGSSRHSAGEGGPPIGPPIDAERLRAAQLATGEDYDRFVLQAIREAGGREVGAGYLRPRVGGPRWKLQSALRRLHDAGLVERAGATSSTRYRACQTPCQTPRLIKEGQRQRD